MQTLALPTSGASKAELGARKITTMQAKTEREARGRGQLRRLRRTLGKSMRPFIIDPLSRQIELRRFETHGKFCQQLQQILLTNSQNLQAVN